MAERPHQQPRQDGLAELIGIEYTETTPELVRARVEVRDRIRQPFGVVHGGAYSAIAETICSNATWLAVVGEGKLAMGMSNSATFLRPIADGHVNAAARSLHRGRTTWIWDVDMTDDDGRLCALVRVTVAVREDDQLSRGSDS
jgi:uncharacterized protein (TIGR00369 family)